MNDPEIFQAIDVLIVEDDEMLNFVMSLQVQLAGYTVRSARTGAAALRMINERLPTVLLLDIGLPDLSGQEIVAELRKSVLTNSIPLIVHTTLDLSREEKAYICLGHTMFVTKSTALSDRLAELIVEITEQTSKTEIGK